MHKIKPLIHHPQSMIKCLVAGVFLVGLFSTLWVANDPKIQKRIKDERAAKSLAKEQEAKKKKEDWEKWFEEAKENTSKRAKEPNEAGWDDGFRLGFMGGKLTRSKTNISPTNSRIEELAQEQLENVAPNSHAGFVRGYKIGWGYGWKDK